MAEVGTTTRTGDDDMSEHAEQLRNAAVFFHIHGLQAEVDKLAKAADELEQLEADRTRLDWYFSVGIKGDDPRPLLKIAVGLAAGKDYRQAIDAARKATT